MFQGMLIIDVYRFKCNTILKPLEVPHRGLYMYFVIPVASQNFLKKSDV